MIQYLAVSLIVSLAVSLTASLTTKYFGCHTITLGLFILVKSDGSCSTALPLHGLYLINVT